MTHWYKSLTSCEELVPIFHNVKFAKCEICGSTMHTCIKVNVMTLGEMVRPIIRKTCPCNEYPCKPHFYIVKLGFAGVYLFFLFLLQNIDCGYLLEPPRRGGSNVYPQSMF